MANDYTRHLWMKEISDAFGLTTAQFTKAIGYSRQTLYSASSGFARLNQGHVCVAVYKLIDLSDKIHEQDIQSAKERHEARRKLIDDFAKRFTVEDA